MTDAIVKTEKRGDVALVRLDDGKANAMGMALITELSAALAQAEKDAKAIVLVGRPDASPRASTSRP